MNLSLKNISINNIFTTPDKIPIGKVVYVHDDEDEVLEDCDWPVNHGAVHGVDDDPGVDHDDVTPGNTNDDDVDDITTVVMACFYNNYLQLTVPHDLTST